MENGTPVFIQKMGKILIFVLFFSFLLGLLLIAIVLLFTINRLIFRGEFAEALLYSLILAANLFLLFLLAWFLNDARRASKHVQRDDPIEPGEDGDMSDVAGIPPRDPWLG